MELKVNPVTLPEPITFNYAELKAALTEKVEHYANLVYTDEQIAVAKADRANLNRLKKALNDERLRREKEYMAPFMQFKAQVAEMIALIDKPAAMIDKQVKEFEQQQKAKKLEAITAYWDSIEHPEGVKLARIMSDKWLNASASMKSIQEAINERLEQINADLAAVRALPAYAFEAEQTYINTLDLAQAVNAVHRLAELAERKAAYEAERAKRREEAAAIKPAEPAEASPTPAAVEAKPSREWIAFQALLTVDEARALGAYFKAHGIQYKAI